MNGNIIQITVGPWSLNLPKKLLHLLKQQDLSKQSKQKNNYLQNNNMLNYDKAIFKYSDS